MIKRHIKKSVKVRNQFILDVYPIVFFVFVRSDLAAVPIVATLMVTGPPLILTYIVYACLQRFCGCCPDDGQDLKAAGQAARSLREPPEGAEDDDDVFEVISDVKKQSEKH